MKKTMEINGVEFEIGKQIKLTKNEKIKYSSKDLFTCYDRPSLLKINIYQEWLEWYYTSENENIKIKPWEFGIYSYNGFMFTLTFPIEVNGKNYHCYITPKHNYINEVIYTSVSRETF